MSENTRQCRVTPCRVCPCHVRHRGTVSWSSSPYVDPSTGHTWALGEGGNQQEKEKLYMELKHILARQPGPEAAEQLQIYRHTLREKTKQLKVLSSELNMYESQSQEYKYEIEKLGNELINVKKKYLAQKRKELIQKNKDKLPIDNTLIAKPPGPHFIGGGFPLTKTPKVKS
ncbi:Coiled-coil domain-containing protein 147 [Heterocephalus glaber]|uniref:Coiled-coil domain-containing protein 147 n=1 Tax=Heterocephalus glaber TaxID=10181 RepID=G5B1L6_HETGA|nr:Coiled-coil domain-containing protein 147 [Heterocephalus glaber]